MYISPQLLSSIPFVEARLYRYCRVSPISFSYRVVNAIAFHRAIDPNGNGNERRRFGTRFPNRLCRMPLPNATRKSWA